MRGKVAHRTEPYAAKGITPAYAGKSILPVDSRTAAQDHPRVCGEKHFFGQCGTALRGSPPRMRGKASSSLPFLNGFRITPAYAGKRISSLLMPRISAGSPPRMRGKAHDEKNPCVGCGITPAYAGKRTQSGLHLPLWKDHPRVCGEKSRLLCFLCNIEGSPPRMRGKVEIADSDFHGFRITPAYAGKSSR